MIGDELVLPPRTRAALREEVAHRLVCRRRQRVRRRVVRLALLAVVVLAVGLGANGMPGVRTGVHTTDNRADPASDGDMETGSDRAVQSGRALLSADIPDLPVSSGGEDGRRSAGSPPSSTPAPATGSATGDDQKGSNTAAGPIRMAVSRPDGIWELDARGAVVRRLLATGSEPAWSPDGRHVAYTKRWEGMGGDGVGVAVLDLDTMQSRYLIVGSEADYLNPVWSPDGNRLAASRLDSAGTTPPDLQPSVVVVDVDGSDRWEFGPGDQPSFRHDGSILYRCADRLCVRPQQGSPIAEVPNSHNMQGAAWSPDGSWIAAWDSSSSMLVAVRPDGSGRRNLVDDAKGYGGWCPDSACVVYPSAQGLRSVQLDGSNARLVTDQPTDADPDLVAGR